MSLFTRLSTSYFFYFAIIGLVAPYLGVFLNGKGFSSLQIGEILAIVTATKIFAPTLWATLADKKGFQLPIIKTGSLLALLFFSLLYWLDTYWSLTACLALFSLFSTAILPQLEVMTLNSIRRSAKIYARIRLWGSLGFIAIAIIAGDLLERFPLYAFSVIGVLALLGLLGSSFLLSQPRIPASHKTKQSSIIDKIIDRRFILFFLSGVFLQISFGPYYGFFALYLNDLNYPGITIGLIIGLGVIAEIITFIFAGSLFRWFSLKSLLIFSLFATVLRWVLVANYGENLLLLIFSQLLHAASFGLYHSVSIQFLTQHFDANQQSRGQALYISGLYGVGGSIGAYIAGVLWLDGAGAQTTFNFAAFSVFIGAVFIMFLPELKPTLKKCKP